MQEAQSSRKGYPDIDEGIESLKFVEACIASSEKNGEWTMIDG